MRTNALNHIVDGTHGETVGHLDGRDMYRLEAVGAMATFTVKMRVHVVKGTLILAITNLIPQHPVAILYGMYHMV